MSDAPKFKTFRDLKSIPSAPAKSNLEVVMPVEVKHSLTSNDSITTMPSNARYGSKGETAVTKDFQKIPNSVTRQFLAQGIFKGKSKQVWDYLWSVSRGAINPSRFVRKSRPEIKNGTGIGSFVTVDKAIKYLEDVGLLKKIELSGSHDGNKFEIFTPEEIASLTSIASNASNTSYTQKVDILVLPESSNTSKAQTPVDTGENASLKTFFKDNKDNDDDLALAGFAAKIEASSRKLTGRGFSKREAAKWEQLADLLILELEIAASRTEGISSVPAFLTEVLRRQFFASKQNQTNELKSLSKTSFKTNSKLQPDTVGKSALPTSENYEIKPLDEQGREVALVQLEEFANESFLGDFAKWYTLQDWQWLTDRLNTSQKLSEQTAPEKKSDDSSSKPKSE